jgi:hypothetical protein
MILIIHFTTHSVKKINLIMFENSLAYAKKLHIKNL